MQNMQDIVAGIYTIPDLTILNIARKVSKNFEERNWIIELQEFSEMIIEEYNKTKQ